MEITRSALAQMVDHTLLKTDATRAQVSALVAEARELGVFSVCVSPSMLPITDELGEVKVATVCGFPSGNHTAAAKAAEAAESSKLGADEIDMVINIGLLKEGRADAVEAEIRAVREATTGLLKVIIESAALTDDEIVAACKAAEAAGADYVKTSTGFHPGGRGVGARGGVDGGDGGRAPGRQGQWRDPRLRDGERAGRGGRDPAGPLSGTRAVLDGADGLADDADARRLRRLTRPATSAWAPPTGSVRGSGSRRALARAGRIFVRGGRALASVPGSPLMVALAWSVRRSVGAAVWRLLSRMRAGDPSGWAPLRPRLRSPLLAGSRASVAATQRGETERILEGRERQRTAPTARHAPAPGSPVPGLQQPAD